MNIYYFTLGFIIGSLVTTGAIQTYDKIIKKREVENKSKRLSGEYDY